MNQNALQFTSFSLVRLSARHEAQEGIVLPHDVLHARHHGVLLLRVRAAVLHIGVAPPSSVLGVHGGSR